MSRTTGLRSSAHRKLWTTVPLLAALAMFWGMPTRSAAQFTNIVNLTDGAFDGQAVTTTVIGPCTVTGTFIGDAFFRAGQGEGDFSSYRRMYNMSDGRISITDPEEGYNRPQIMDVGQLSPQSFTYDIRKSNLVTDINGLYYVFALDANDGGGIPGRYLSLDDVQIFAYAGGADPSPLPTNRASLATSFGPPLYAMNSSITQSHVILDCDLNPGSGRQDMFMFVKKSVFDGVDLGTRIYVYSAFGTYGLYDPSRTDTTAEDGFEEWALPLDDAITLTGSESAFVLNMRAFLEGPYRTSTHAMQASNPANIPVTSPYAIDPRTVTAIPSNAVDWVLVELVDTNGSTLVSKSAFLDAGGQLLAADGSLGIPAALSAGYYSVVLRHRNHLAATSAQPVAFTNYSATYDFTTNASQYAGGTNAAVQLEAGVWGLAAGDADGDGEILDVDAVICTNQLGQAGYHRGDFNLDGTVDGSDLALWAANGGRQSGASAPGTPLSPGLAITPQRKTVLGGTSFALTALGTTNPVNWAFASNPSGGTLSSLNTTSAVYTAGMVSNSVDVVAAWEGDRLGRAWINVIGQNDAAAAGRAIVIAGGKGPNDTLREETDYLGHLAYNTLLYRGYAKDKVRYLNPNPDQDVDGNGTFDDVASSTTFAGSASTFTNWAMVGTDRLFIYLVDHGGTSSGTGYFRLNGGETLTAAQLDGWLDAIQDARGNELIVVLDFCEAGSFLEPLKRVGRTVIAACGSGEPTYFVAGGLVSFSDAFFGAIISGQDLAGAFTLARDAMATYQGAWLDFNGDGIYQTGVDPGQLAGAHLYLGPSFIAGKDIPQVGHVMGGQLLQGATAATLWAYDISSAYPVDRVWCAVVPPSHDPDPANPVADLPTLDLSYNAATGRYESQYDGFAEMGTYKLVYYARDIWGSVSLPHPSFVEQAGYDERMVIVAGGSTNDQQWSATANLAAWAYQTALARRLGKPALRYLSAGPPQDIDGDGTNDATAAATLANLGDAITTWSTNSCRLTVYLLGSSTSNGLCRLNDSEALPAAQFDGWLDSYQATNTSALVVMDFDGCGAYVPSLVAPPDRERIVIASAKAGAPRLCGHGGLISFSRFFLSGVFNGKSLKDAFDGAREAIKSASGRLKQTPQLDDSGDGTPDQKNVDGLVASTRYLGAAFATGADAPFIGSVNPDGFVVAGAPVTLWASNVLADAGISNVWCAITPPDYDGSGELPQTNLAWNATSNRYDARYSNFTLPGTYALTFFALANDGLLSAPVQSLITATDAYEPDDTNALATICSTAEIQLHSIHTTGDEDWVVFCAPSGLVFNIEATQLGTNSDLVLELYYGETNGALSWVDGVDLSGAGSNETEAVVLDLTTGTSGCLPGLYYVRVCSYDTNLFGPGSEYSVGLAAIYPRDIYPIGTSGGVGGIMDDRGQLFQYGTFYISLAPSNALAAGAAWRIEEIGGTWRTDNMLYSLPVIGPDSWHIEFREAEGFAAPAGQLITLRANEIISVAADYSPIFSYTNPVPQIVAVSMGAGGAFRLDCIAKPGNSYAIEESTDLLQWVPIATNQVPQDGSLHFSVTNSPSKPRAFYRWLLIR